MERKGMEKKITDLNIVGMNPGKHAALLGDAHELIVAGILIRLGFEVATLAVKGAPYDLWVMAYEEPGGRKVPLRTQVKTASPKGYIKFVGGVRAGVDREYIPGVKKYKYTTKHNDLIIGVNRYTLDLYLIPTRFVEMWGESKSLKKLEPLKNNWEILLNWNDRYLEKLRQELE